MKSNYLTRSLPRNPYLEAVADLRITSSLGQVFSAGASAETLTSLAWRQTQMDRNEGTDIGDRAGNSGFRPSGRVAKDKVSAEALNEEYSDIGLSFDAPVSAETARLMAEAKREEMIRNDIITRGKPGLKTAAASLTGALLASAVDPLEMAAAMTPVVGPARSAAMIAKLGAFRGRVAIGATEGLVGSLAMEPMYYTMSKQQQLDYTLNDFMLNTVLGASLGAGLGAGAGVVKKLSASPRSADFDPAKEERVRRVLRRRATRAPDAPQAVPIARTPDSIPPRPDGAPAPAPVAAAARATAPDPTARAEEPFVPAQKRPKKKTTPEGNIGDDGLPNDPELDAITAAIIDARKKKKVDGPEDATTEEKIAASEVALAQAVQGQKTDVSVALPAVEGFGSVPAIVELQDGEVLKVFDNGDINSSKDIVFTNQVIYVKDPAPFRKMMETEKWKSHDAAVIVDTEGNLHVSYKKGDKWPEPRQSKIKITNVPAEGLYPIRLHFDVTGNSGNGKSWYGAMIIGKPVKKVSVNSFTEKARLENQAKKLAARSASVESSFTADTKASAEVEKIASTKSDVVSQLDRDTEELQKTIERMREEGTLTPEQEEAFGKAGGFKEKAEAVGDVVRAYTTCRIGK